MQRVGSSLSRICSPYLAMTTDVAEATSPNAIRAEVKSVFSSYPQPFRKKLLALRQVIFDTAATIPTIAAIEETLKWGEPSYLVHGGSTIRLAWKAKTPEHYGVYFNCNTKLVDTFKERYGDGLHFEGNRAIVFHRNEDPPIEIMSVCFELALRYHSVKHLSLLGA